jgi:glycosyltransferase involved in cell wall biosynthesis
MNTLIGFVTGAPMNTAAYASGGMKRAVKKLFHDAKPDCIFCYRLRSAQYAQGYNVPKAIDIVDSLSLYLKRQAGSEKSIMRRIYSFIDAPRVFRTERMLDGAFDTIFVNYEEDAEFIGIDDIIIAPNGGPRIMVPPKAGKKKIVGFLGNMNYAPNADAADWFVKNVWKKRFESDKNIKLVIAGSGGEKLGILGANIEVRGFIPDLEKEVRSWSLSVIPVRYGAGRQNKIMFSWACGVPVVSTKFAAAGVYGKHGVNMLVAADAKEFMECIERTAGDKRTASKIVNGGYKTLKKFFSWEKTGAIVSGALKKITRS